MSWVSFQKMLLKGYTLSHEAMNSTIEEQQQQQQKIDLLTLLKSWISQGLVAVHHNRSVTCIYMLFQD